MLESCLFSQLNVELLCLQLFHFLLFLCSYLLWEIFSRKGLKKNSDVFWKISHVFGETSEIFREMSNVYWGSAEHSLTISEKCSRNARGMLEVKEVFKGHKARFYDEMEQNTAKGDKKPQILFWGIWAKNGLYSVILRSLDCKMGRSEIFLRFFCRKSW